MDAVSAGDSGLAPMSLQDLDAVTRIEHRVCPFPWSRGNFADSIASGYCCWVYRQAGETLGYFVLMVAVDEAHLLNIAVAETVQGMGLGARLLRHAMRTAKAVGARSLLLEVRPSTATAVLFYRHFGFRQIGVRRAYYPAAGGREDALVLARQLDEEVEA